RLAEAIARQEEAQLARSVHEVAEVYLELAAVAQVLHSRLDTDPVRAGFENVVGQHLDREVDVVRGGRKRQVEAREDGAGIQKVEEVVDAGDTDDRRLPVEAVVQYRDVRVVGGALDVHRRGELLEAVALRADAAHEVGIDDLPAVLADAEQVALQVLHDDADLV